MNDRDVKRTFLNRRDWGSFVVAIQNAATSPKLIDVLKTGRAWLGGGRGPTSTLLVETAITTATAEKLSMS